MISFQQKSIMNAKVQEFMVHLQKKWIEIVLKEAHTFVLLDEDLNNLS